jgi:hypothetical protein
MGYGGVRRKSKKDIRNFYNALNSMYVPRSPTGQSHKKLNDQFAKAMRGAKQTRNTRASQPKRKGGRRK